MFQNLMQNIRYGFRVLRKTPVFTVAAIITLALGIGANTAIFSVTNAVMLRYLPASRNPERLVYLHTTNLPDNSSQTGSDTLSFTLHTFEQLRQEKSAFADLMAYVPLGVPKVAVRYGNDPEEAQVDMVSGNFFSGLGVSAVRGRTFGLDDERNHTQTAVLSYAFWTRRFDRTPDVIGQTIFVKGIPFTIVGVAAKGFDGLESGAATDLWVPLQNRPDLNAWGQSASDSSSLYGSPDWWCLMMVGRLPDGLTEPQVIARANPIFERSAYDNGAKRDSKSEPPRLYFSPARGIGTQRDGFGRPLAILMAMVGLVLAMSCGNVAMLLVARNSTREREFSLRLALGAGRGQLFAQLLTESLLMVIAGGLLGWVFATWATKALAAWSQLEVDMAPDTRVLLFTMAISVLAALVFGLAPLRNAVRIPTGMALKTTGATSQDRRKFRGGQIIVAVQMSMCLVLLVGAGLMVRTIRNLENADLGLRTSGLVVFGMTPPQTTRTDADVVRFYGTLTSRLRTLPGVHAVTLMQNRIGSGWANNTYAHVDGAVPTGQYKAMRWNTIGPDYFHVLGANILLGRDISEADTEASAKVVVINQTFAQRYLPGVDPLGHHVSIGDGPKATQYSIVGVVADNKYTGVREAARGMAYFPYTQVPGISTMHFELRTEGKPETVLPEVRKAVHEFGPDLPLLQPMTQQEQFRETFSSERLFARLAFFFGLLAAMLVATGLYGTLAYRVSRRTAEIGVRMALGAQRGHVLWMVLRESLVLGLIGTLVGLPLAVAGARLLRSLLYEIGPGDPLTFVICTVSIAAVALCASMVPARRASSVDPIVALRYE